MGYINDLYTLQSVSYLSYFFHCPQGNCAENTAKKFSISREDQDTYAIKSYTQSKEGWNSGIFAKEIVPVTISQKGSMD